MPSKSSEPKDAGTDAEAERLYGLDPDEFVAARTATARELRGAGRRGEAAAVEKLRKPSVAAWIVNRLVRDEPKLIGTLLDAGARLREAQLGGASATDLREAIAAEAAALDALIRPAERVATGSGSGRAGALARARDTLHAAALDPDVAGDVRRGVVVRERQAVGFPLGAALPDRPPRAERPQPKVKPAGGNGKPSAADQVAAKRLERAAAAAAVEKAKLADAESALADAEDEAAAAKDALDGAHRAVSAAERRAQHATRTADTARRAVAAARQRADKAAARDAELRERR